jgi:hypothetical protein
MADHHGDPPVSPNKRKHIVWNEQNLMYNEQNKSAKMTIDEPDTPWASPPRELFEDPKEDDARDDVENAGRENERERAADMDDVAHRLRDIDTSSAANAGSASASLAGGSAEIERNAERDANEKSEWDESDDEADAGASGQPPSRLAFPDPGPSAGSRDERGEPEDFEAHTDADRELKARLFEAQRKSHQCTFRGVMARGKALLDKEEDDER